MKKLYNINSTEPNMRKEMENTLYGTFPEVAKAQKACLRRMRRDDDGDLIACSCVDEVTHEPDLDTFCPFCWGEGWIWDEVLIDVYKVVLRSPVGLAAKEDLIAPGTLNIPLVSFYAPYNVEVDEFDKLIELVLDTAGDPVLPFSRERLYRIGTAIDFRSDNAKLEYWKLDCFEEQRKFLNGIGR